MPPSSNPLNIWLPLCTISGTCRHRVPLHLLGWFISRHTSTLHFLGFPVDSDQFPAMVWCDGGLVASFVTALWLPSVSTVADFSHALGLDDRNPEAPPLAVQTDGLQFLSDDRFRPRVGRLHFLRPVLHSDEDEVAFLQHETVIKIPSPVAIDAEHGLCPVEDVTEPPCFQVRPNPEIRLAFDQDIPITRRTAEGEVVIGRVIPPPRWEENSVNRAAVAAGAQYRAASGQLNVQFRSWLVKHGNRQAAFGQSRDFTLRAQLVVRIREKLKRIWNDHIGQDDTLQVHIVHPAPFTEPETVGVLHVIAEINRRPRSPLQPVLLAARELASLSVSRPLWRAGLLPQDFDTEDAFDLCMPVCERHQLLVPVGGASRAWMGPRSTRRAQPGLFIPVWWDERLSAEEAANIQQHGDDDDEAIFMQPAIPIVRPSISPNLVEIRLLGLHQTSSLIRVDSTLPLLDQVAERWPFLHRSYDELETLHEVGHPPSFVSGSAERRFLMQFRDDRFEQVHEDDVLILLTIKFRAPHTSNHQKQKVKVLWGPRHSTRDQFIDFVRMRWFCRRPLVLCFLNYNNQIWGELDTTQREFADGDHVRLQVRSEREDWCDFEHAKITSRQLRIWEDSPPPDPIEDTSADSVPSRSRSRSIDIRRAVHPDTSSYSLIQRSATRRTYGTVADRAAEADDESDDELLSLIQTGAQRRLRQQGLFSAVDPHVSDRWCDKQSETSPGCTLASDPDLPFDSVSSSSLSHAAVKEAHDPTPPFDDSTNSVEEPVVYLNFQKAILAYEWMDSHLFLPVYDLDADWPWKPESIPWIQLPWWTTGRSAQQIYVYFDGSASRDREQAGCRVAAFVYDDEWTFAGAISAQLPAGTTSYGAEAAGSALAVKFIYDILKLASIYSNVLPEIWLCYDSTSVGEQTEARQQPHLMRTLRSLLILIEQRFQVHVNHHHIYGHSGDPGNELVDTLAWKAGQGNPLVDAKHFLDWIQTEDFVSDFSWAWFLFRSDVPLHWHGSQLVLPAGPSTSPSSEVVQIPQHTLTPVVCDLHLCLATLNVLTLKGKDSLQHGLQGPTRQQVVLQQLFDAGANIFALQETRQKRQSSATDERYILFASPATTQGHFGITVGFDKLRPHGTITDPDGQSRAVLFRKEHFSIISRAPRFLIIKVHSPALRCIVIAGHAPHTGTTVDDCRSWWEELGQQIPHRLLHWDRIVLTDANCRLGHFPSECVGPWQAEIDTAHSDAFHDFLRQEQLWLPATFQECHSGNSGTWRHNNGSWYRGDYVAIPQRWF